MEKIKTSELKLRKWFLAQTGVLVAFSGGIDSALLLFLARKYLGKEKVIGVISKSSSLKERDLRQARVFAERHDITLRIVETNEIDDPEYNTNPPDRCFICKNYLYHVLWQVKREFPGFTIVNGTNKDDFLDFRPGHKAAENYHVQSPLVLCGFSKKMIRELAYSHHLDIWDKPASPCLSSRIPYGNPVTRKKLKQIEIAEEILNEYGFREVRARHYGKTCKIEISLNKIQELKAVFNEVSDQIIRNTGFKECVMDEEGFISGKLNKDIKKVGYGKLYA